MNPTARYLVSVALSAVLGAALALPGCAPANEEGDSDELVGAPEVVDTGGAALTGSLAVGAQLVATANVNLRSGPATSKSIVRVLPEGAKVTLEAALPTAGFYKVKSNGTVGWSFGQYLKPVASPTSTGSGTAPMGTGSAPGTLGGVGLTRDESLARAKAGVGFSYWWGHARFQPSGATSANKGSCSGICPNCQHGGQWGGDCSGLVGKAWQVSGSQSDLTADAHPYSTVSFVEDTTQWSTISRGDLKPADAMVYNTNGKGHIFLYESGDGWGSLYAYECKACAEGCVYDLRTASSAYKAIRRTGL